VDLKLFVNDSSGHLVRITGSDPRHGPWEHCAFVPAPLPEAEPALSGATHRTVAGARAALAGLDATAKRLPNPHLLRTPALRREAQATSALEGTYAPFEEVLGADEGAPSSHALREILNYVAMAEHAFDWVQDGRPLTVGLLETLQGMLVDGTPSAVRGAGRIREEQVVIGRRSTAATDDLAVHAARYIPPPPGPELRSLLSGLIDWMGVRRSRDIDPVVSAAMSHYHFEAVHPFQDGNGRIGRLLVVISLLLDGVLEDPTLTVSPWFEVRRTEYYNHLQRVSTDGDWDSYVAFFATGVASAAESTQAQMLSLIDVRDELRGVIRASSLRAESALRLVDHALANPSFGIAAAMAALHLSQPRVKKLVDQLTELGVLEPTTASGYRRRYRAPRVWDVLLGASWRR
jgi:Fic family protein